MLNEGQVPNVGRFIEIVEKPRQSSVNQRDYFRGLLLLVSHELSEGVNGQNSDN